MSLLASLRETLRARVGIDARALAALRIALGLLVLCDLALRLPDIAAFYTDAGVLPRSLLFELYPTIGRLSLYSLSGSLAWAILLFGLTALSAVALVVGYRSRLAALVLFVLLLSLHTRNLAVLNAGDSLLRRLLLWSVLLPVGRRWSLDATDTRTDTVVSVATAGLLVQVLAVYVVNAVLKLRGDAWRAGTAVEYIYRVDSLTVGLGDLLAGSPLLSAASHAWLVVLLCSPLLLFVRRLRVPLVGVMAGGHLFMLATLRLGVFPLVSIASLVVFLPAGVWHRVESSVPREQLVAATQRLPRPSRHLPGRVVVPTARTVAALLLAFVLVWNAAGVGAVTAPNAPVDPTDRRWDMFAPEPLTTDSWYVPVGETTTGERVDAFRGGAPAFAPGDSGETYPSHRWYVYLTDMRRSPTLAPGFGRYLCDRWNQTHADGLASVDIVAVTQSVVDRDASPPERRSLGRVDC